MARRLVLVLALVPGSWPSLSQLSWTPVTDRTSLSAGLSCPSCLLSLGVTNGTEWLQIGGSLDSFLPIVTGESEVAATSDLSLLHALKLFRDSRVPGSSSGLVISFHTPSIIPASIAALAAVFPDPELPFPLLVSGLVLDSSGGRSAQPLTPGDELLQALAEKVPGARPLLGWSTFHGLDPVWRRIDEEGLLRHFQTVRLEGLLDRLYRDPGGLPAEEVRFAELLEQKLGRGEGAASFTALAVTQLVAAIRANGRHTLEAVSPWAPRLPSRPPRKEPVRALLSNYYLASSRYTEGDTAAMAALTGNTSSGTGFLVRAGLIAGPRPCPHILALLDSRPGSFLAVRRLPTDREGRADLRPCIRAIGRHRVVLMLPEGEEGEGEGEDIRVPEPREGVEGGAAACTPALLALLLLPLLL